jgi:hypothetical protein
MHCEKNFCENLLKTLFGDSEKDYARGCQDLKELNIRPDLWLRPILQRPGEYIMPHASYTMTLQEKRKFISTIAQLMTPKGIRRSAA